MGSWQFSVRNGLIQDLDEGCMLFGCLKLPFTVVPKAQVLNASFCFPLSKNWQREGASIAWDFCKLSTGTATLIECRLFRKRGSSLFQASLRLKKGPSAGSLSLPQKRALDKKNRYSSRSGALGLYIEAKLWIPSTWLAIFRTEALSEYSRSFPW